MELPFSFPILNTNRSALGLLGKTKKNESQVRNLSKGGGSLQGL